MALLDCHQVTRSFYGVHALRGADLAVEPRRITGLIGPNGAGKTTLFNCISGLVPAGSRPHRLRRPRYHRRRPDQISRRGLVRTFQIARGLPRLSVLENLMLYGPRQPGESLGAGAAASARDAPRETRALERALAVAARLNLTRGAPQSRRPTFRAGRRSFWRSAAR